MKYRFTGPPALKKFRFLTSKLTPAASTAAPATRDSVAVELAKYIQELDGLQGNTASPLDFWADRRALYPRLTPVAEDLVAAPASQAYIERIFSVAGMLSSGRRNRMHQSLEMRVFLKVNNKLNC